MMITTGASPIGAQDTVVVADGPGVAFVPADAPLIGLNYFDGRFLRADDLNLERRGQRTYAELSNQARGTGVVWGFDLTAPDGATLALSAGLAVDPQGRVLHLPVAVTAAVRDVLGAGTAATAPTGPDAPADFGPCTTAVTTPPSTAAVGGTTFFLVSLASATGLCGQAEVLGRLCDDGCVTAADRPYVVDGVRLLLRPLDLNLSPYVVAGVTIGTHLRSQVAAAYFARERAEAGSLLSAAGLAAATWSAGATAAGGDVVPVGVLGWNGSTTTFLDVWTARRELIDPFPAHYWAGRVEQRPWSVFLAQVLQFQAQRTALAPPVPTPAVPARILLERGIVELPPAGYLPVDPNRPDLRAQVQDLMGPGVALRLCAVPRDQVPRELERAQHLDRISLLRSAQGRDPEPVDVLVPDGTVVTAPAARHGVTFAVDARAGDPPLTAERNPLSLIGAARRDDGKPVDLRLAVIGAATQGMTGLVTALANQFVASSPDPDDLARRRPRPVEPDVVLLRRIGDAAFTATVRQRAGLTEAGPRLAAQGAAAWVQVVLDADPFTLGVKASTFVDLELDLSVTGGTPLLLAAQIVRGQVQRLPADGRDPAHQVVVRLFGALQVVGNDSAIPVPDTPPVVDVKLVLHRGTQDGRAWFAVSDEAVNQAAVLVETDAPAGARAALASRRGGTPDVTPVVAALAAPDPYEALGKLQNWRAQAALVAQADPEVAQPTEQHHEAAVSALRTLFATHDELDYVATRNRLLFPPEDTAVTAEVRPTTDWVLFRRRTSKDCEGASVPPPQAAPVTVWIRTEDGESRAADVAGAIATGKWPDDPDGPGWRRADVVFDPDDDSLLTEPGTWQQRYIDAQGGPHIRLAVYAGTPSSPAALHGPGRLDALLTATPPAAELDVGATVGFALDGAGRPPVLPATDGSVFLVTYTVPDASAPQLAVVGVVDGSAVATAVDTDDAATVGQPDAGLDRFGDFAAQATDLSSMKGELELRFVNQPKPQSVRTVLWIDPALPSADRTDLVELAKRAATAAEPVIASTAQHIEVGEPHITAPPAELPRAALFLLFPPPPIVV